MDAPAFFEEEAVGGTTLGAAKRLVGAPDAGWAGVVVLAMPKRPVEAVGVGLAEGFAPKGLAA